MLSYINASLLWFFPSGYTYLIRFGVTLTSGALRVSIAGSSNHTTEYSPSVSSLSPKAPMKR